MMKRIAKILIRIAVLIFIAGIIFSCDPISLKTTIDNLILGWTRAVTLTYPEDEEQIAVKQPVLDWEDAGGATGYQVQIGNTDDFDDITPIDIEEAVSEYQIPDKLIIRDVRYWRVRAVNNGVPSDEWSETRSFEIVVSSSPEVVGIYDTRSEFDASSNSFSVSLSGSTAFLALDDPGMIALDFSDPSNPTLLDSYKPPSNGIYHSDISGNQLYCLDSGADPRLRVIDVSDPSNLSELDLSGTGIAGNGMVTTLGTVTMAVEGTDLKYYDTSLSSSISVNDTAALGGQGWIPEIFNLRCHVVVDDQGLRIYEAYTSNLLGTYPMTDVRHFYSGIAGVSNYVYVIHGHPDTSSEGILILDCANAGSPFLIDTFTYPDYQFIGALEVSRNYLFAGCLGAGKEGIAVLDISNPTSPVLAGFVEFEGSGWFEISGNYVVSPDYSTGKVYFVDLLPEG